MARTVETRAPKADGGSGDVAKGNDVSNGNVSNGNVTKGDDIRANDNPRPDMRDRHAVYRARRSLPALFAPPVATLAVCILGFAAFRQIHGPGSAMASAYLLAGAIVVPALMVIAVMRLYTLELRVLPHFIRVHRGFPAARHETLALAAIDRVGVLRGIGGRLTNSMTLRLTLADRGTVTVRDLAYDESLIGFIHARIHIWHDTQEPVETPAHTHEDRAAS